MDRSLDHKPDTIIELTKPTHGLWCYPTNPESCCIYRVPHYIRRVNPEGYTPQQLLIGPLHHYLKSQPSDVSNTKSMGYLNMEEYKKIYLAEFAKRFEGKELIERFKAIIKEEEEMIRASYSESTSWIKAPEFREMILLDSVFILEHMLKFSDGDERTKAKKTGNHVVDNPCLENTLNQDLILLENQLPYFILEKLFDPIFPRLRQDKTFRQFILCFFRLSIRDGSIFRHFTDLHRRVRIETLDQPENTTNTREESLGTEGPTESTNTNVESLEIEGQTVATETIFSRLITVITDSFQPVRRTKYRLCTGLLPYVRFKRNSTKPEGKIIKHIYNAEKLYGAGVEFVPVEEEFSINVSFENGCLKIPCLWVCDDTEAILRNIMALEQCHYPLETYVCNYVTFLDFLIDTEKDVDLLIDNGVIRNWIGKHSLVADMVNKLFSGIVQGDSHVSDIASKLNAYYENPFNKTRAVLGRLYFVNIWTGTATVAAMFLLMMTLTQTVTSVIQVFQK